MTDPISAAWTDVEAARDRLSGRRIADLFAADSERFAALSARVADMLLDPAVGAGDTILDLVMLVVFGRRASGDTRWVSWLIVTFFGDAIVICTVGALLMSQVYMLFRGETRLEIMQRARSNKGEWKRRNPQCQKSAHVHVCRLVDFSIAIF